MTKDKKDKVRTQTLSGFECNEENRRARSVFGRAKRAAKAKAVSLPSLSWDKKDVKEKL